MYGVASHMWIKVVSMHFVGVAARWLQPADKRIKSCSWNEFCSMIHDRFGRDQHEALIRQLFHIKQTESVAHYVKKFLELVDQLAAYESPTDPLYFAMHFVDGLKHEIKASVMIQRPSDLDDACALALVHEEAMETQSKPTFRGDSYFTRSMPR
ncbi:hypothetical protein QOZ80_7AG0564790 [Eleusine coracana subsp. coracana]|nr:hypothetical protein QOZ80_7AG0564790 [Eleusine coracana subsp. coracana]